MTVLDFTYNALGQDLKFLTDYDKKMYKNTNVGATNAKKV
jgi:hypothetical protein